MRRFLLWASLAAVAVAIAAAAGRLQPHAVPDTPSYTEFPLGDLEAMLRHPRTPGYPVLLAFCRGLTGSLAWMPVLQVLVHVTASVLFAAALGDWGVARGPRWSAAVAVGFGCTVIDHVATLATDAPAASLGVLTAAGLLAWARRPAERWPWAASLLAAWAAISLRPAYLFIVPWLGVAGFLLLRLRRWSVAPAARRAALLFGIGIVPILAVALLRWGMVGEFGVVAFGGQNLSGVLVQLVDREELRALPGEAGELGRGIAARWERYAAQHPEWAEADRSAYMTWDQRWDTVTWQFVVPVLKEHAGADDDVAMHRATNALNRAILQRRPLAYLVWLAKAARQAMRVAVGDLVTQPLFLGVLGVLLGLFVVRAAAGRALVRCAPVEGLDVMWVLALSYAVMKTALVILSSPAIGRFIDAAAIFLPAAVAMWAWGWVFTLPDARRDGRRRPAGPVR